MSIIIINANTIFLNMCEYYFAVLIMNGKLIDLEGDKIRIVDPVGYVRHTDDEVNLCHQLNTA